MKLKTLKDLYVSELKDLYSAEKQILKALPKMAKAATVARAEGRRSSNTWSRPRGTSSGSTRSSRRSGTKPTGKTCKAMEGLVEEGKELIDEEPEPTVLDAGLIAAAQRVEHYEMAGYGTVRTFAKILGENDAARLLQQTLDEEGETDKKLTKLAEGLVNAQAV